MPSSDCLQPPNSTEPPQTPQSQYPFTPIYWTPLPEPKTSLRQLAQSLRIRWKFITSVTLAGTTAAVCYALLATPMYRAQAILAAPRERPPNPASTALASFAGLGAEIAGSLGFSIGSNDVHRLETLLNSHRLLNRVVQKHGLLQILFDEDWNSIDRTWTTSDPEDIPNVWDAHEALGKIYSAKVDPKSSEILVSLEAKKAETATSMLNAIVEELATMVQEDEITRIQQNTEFINKQLASATDPFIVAKLQSLLSEQVERAMMAQNTNEFAYELVDPPAASDIKVRPRRKLIVASSFVFSLSFSCIIALAHQLV